MSAVQKIELTEEAKQTIAGLQTLPVRVVNYIAAAMNQENVQTVSHIQKTYLSFSAAQKPTPLGLRRQSGDYRNSLHASEAVVSGEIIDSGIGSNVKNNGFSYPRLHEFGGRCEHKPRTIRLRVDARGNRVKQLANSNLVRFAKKSGKRFEEVAAKGYVAEYPARAPIQHGIADRKANYTKSISAATMAAFRSLKGN